MALDGVVLHFLAHEINALAGARVDRVQQPEKDEIDLIFRRRGGGAKLLLSASAHPRVHLSEEDRENPMTAPMFCMLLRKHLGGAKFMGVRQPGLERILYLDFDCRNELGDLVRETLSIEIMGRYSNILLIGPDDRIIDAIKHIDFTMSAKRQILPKLPYIMPPAQDKIDLLLHPPVEALQRVLAQKKPLEKALLAAVQGISPLVCRELCVQVSCDGMTSAAEIDDVSKGRLLATLTALCHNIQSYSGEPYLLSDSQTNLPLEFSFMPITQYGSKVQSQKMASFSELLDMFYGERDRVLRVHQRAHDILQVVNRTTERISRKINKQRVELSESENRDTLKECGDILSANLYQLKRGMDSCILENFYHNNEPKKIALDVRMTPAQNAQKYYKEYHKAATAQNYLTEQISSGEEELIYLETVLDEVTRASGESDIMEIREELQDGGYLRKRGQKSVKKRVHKPRRFLSDDGFEIFVGRNNKQNDRLTLKTAAKTDVWFHTKDIPGAHVIVFADGQEVPERTLTQAAILAATNSKAGESAQVSVDYVQARYVKKPTGAKPGKVIYDHYHTAYVRPDKELEERLEKQAAQSHSQS